MLSVVQEDTFEKDTFDRFYSELNNIQINPNLVFFPKSVVEMFVAIFSWQISKSVLVILVRATVHAVIMLTPSCVNVNKDIQAFIVKPVSKKVC